MNTDEIRASYRRAFADVGETVTLKRLGGSLEAQVLARPVGFEPQEIAAGVDQGERKLLVLAEDVEAAVTAGTWAAAGGDLIVKNDRITMRGRMLVVQRSDDSTRRVAGVLMAYEVRAMGS